MSNPIPYSWRWKSTPLGDKLDGYIPHLTYNSPTGLKYMGHAIEILYDGDSNFATSAVTTSPTDVSIVILFDVSGSMQNTLPLAKEVLKGVVIEGYSRKIELHFVKFNDEARLWWNSNQESADDFSRKVDALTADGGTDFVKAFQQALNILRESKRNSPHIILITDGEQRGLKAEKIRDMMNGFDRERHVVSKAKIMTQAISIRVTNVESIEFLKGVSQNNHFPVKDEKEDIGKATKECYRFASDNAHALDVHLKASVPWSDAKITEVMPKYQIGKLTPARSIYHRWITEEKCQMKVSLHFKIPGQSQETIIAIQEETESDPELAKLTVALLVKQKFGSAIHENKGSRPNVDQLRDWNTKVVKFISEHSTAQDVPLRSSIEEALALVLAIAPTPPGVFPSVASKRTTITFVEPKVLAEKKNPLYKLPVFTPNDFECTEDYLMPEEVKKSAEQYQISTNAGPEPDCSVARNGFVPMAVEWFFKFEQDRKVFYQVPVVDRIIKGMERKQEEEEEEEDKKGQQQTGPLSRVAPTDTRRPDYVASLCYSRGIQHVACECYAEACGWLRLYYALSTKFGLRGPKARDDYSLLAHSMSIQKIQAEGLYEKDLAIYVQLAVAELEYYKKNPSKVRDYLPEDISLRMVSSSSSSSSSSSFSSSSLSSFSSSSLEDIIATIDQACEFEV